MSFNESTGDDACGNKDKVDVEKNMEIIDSKTNEKIEMMFRPHVDHYAFKPTSVPPFVLDQDFKKLRTKNSNLLNTDTIYNENIRYKENNTTRDPFLNSDVEKWGHLYSNIGNHVTYTSAQRMIPVPDGFQNSSTTISSSSNASLMSRNRSNENEQDQEYLKEFQLNDLDSEWGGEERLNGVYNQPILQNYYDVKTSMNSKEWYAYLSKIKDFYYIDTFHSRKHNSSENSSDSDKFKSDWLEELNKEKDRWRRFRRSKYQKWKPLMKELILNSHYVPLTFRLIIVIFCTISLGIASRIFINSNDTTIETINGRITQQASTIMAICVNSFAITYSVYIAHDEFTGKPLGLRDPLKKLSLILLDLLFIIFSSANLALAFNTLYDPKWVCIDDDDLRDKLSGNGYSTSDYYPKVAYICDKQRALSAFLFILMFTWVVTFAITIFRVVQRVRSQSPQF